MMSAKTERDSKAPEAFQIRRGEKLTAMTGVVVTRRPGIVRMLKQWKLDNLTVPAGAVLFTLHHSGEGYSLFWYKGKTYSGELYAETVHKGTVDYPWDVESVPVTEWWAKIRSRTGVIGWILNPASRFEGMDACGQ